MAHVTVAPPEPQFDAAHGGGHCDKGAGRGGEGTTHVTVAPPAPELQEMAEEPRPLAPPARPPAPPPPAAEAAPPPLLGPPSSETSRMFSGFKSVCVCGRGGVNKF